AGILITFINVAAGFAIGVWQKGLTLVDALHKYTLLSIGDGLVAQIPALIVSVAAGILVTRTGASSNLSSFVGKQLTVYPRAIGITGVMLAIFALMPGIPVVPFLLLGGLCGYSAYFMKKRGMGKDALASKTGLSVDGAQETVVGKEGSISSDASKTPIAHATEFDKIIRVDTLCIELGFGLVHLADNQRGGDLLDRVTGVRKALAKDLGIVIPPIAVRDNPELESGQYAFLLRNKELVRTALMPSRWLAMNIGRSVGARSKLVGDPTVEPVFGLESVWIEDSERANAEAYGYTVVDAASVLITHLSETLKSIAHMTLEREDTQRLIDMVKERHPTLV
ncbi:MAG TPA: FHIPEP family type III secretion protein, partial [Opitutales bacterium]|nr:FHIPEP family type III secretion protein [Opitutales bacterium]